MNGEVRSVAGLTRDQLEALGAVEKVREEKGRLAKEFASKTWRESEIEEYREIIQASEFIPTEIGFMALNEAIVVAKQEGRFVDDTERTYRNLRAAFGEGLWLMSSVEIMMIGSLGAWLAQQDQSRKAARPSGDVFVTPPAHSLPATGEVLGYSAATDAWVGRCMASGRIVTKENHAGLVFHTVYPEWSHNVQIGRITEGSIAPQDKPLEEAQRQRWEVLRNLWELIVEEIQADPAKAQVATEPEDIIPFLKQTAGMRWEPFADLEPFRANLKRFVRETGEAARILKSEAAKRVEARRKLAMETAETRFQDENSGLLRRAGLPPTG